MSDNKIELSIGSLAQDCQVKVNGEDITNTVRRITVIAEAGRATIVMLEGGAGKVQPFTISGYLWHEPPARDEEVAS